MMIRTKALSVHFLTATGAVFSLLALDAAVERNWSVMFLWLVVALVVDGIDGPLARRYDVKHNAPVFDGVLMDLIIDYLTYVFIPAYALFKSDLLPGWPGWLVVVAITYFSVVYFSDTRMKTKDNSFSGFPGCWNMVAIVVFATTPSPPVILVLVLICTIAMFLPLKFIHPVRTQRWRKLSLPVALGWVVFAAIAAWTDFQSGPLVHSGLVVTSLYLLFVGIVQQLVPIKTAASR
ncbi:CDP-alcohol phosphatidyltransferase family protein [Thioclava kandeliae]|uniref:Phosphatidylcholine synthase n=1 Tax=Thioclava kandeliae TaxID=3070818 RepID=A0ABV1SFU7_9RHOB